MLGCTGRVLPFQTQLIGMEENQEAFAPILCTRCRWLWCILVQMLPWGPGPITPFPAITCQTPNGAAVGDAAEGCLIKEDHVQARSTQASPFLARALEQWALTGGFSGFPRDWMIDTGLTTATKGILSHPQYLWAQGLAKSTQPVSPARHDPAPRMAAQCKHYRRSPSHQHGGAETNFSRAHASPAMGHPVLSQPRPTQAPSTPRAPSSPSLAARAWEALPQGPRSSSRHHIEAAQ